jgi:L-lysine exporter family protein LysE/ArgO
MMLDPHWDAAAHGFAVNIALIMIVGPQNLLVIRQALLGRHLLTSVVVCLAVDAALIAIGVAGLGAVMIGRPWIAGIIPWAAVAFLLFYAARAWRTAATPAPRSLDDTGAQGASRASAAGAAFAVSALNPHAYLDCAVIMGGLAAAFSLESRLLFCAGAILASVVWFFGLGYGANRLSPWLCRPGSLRALDQTAAISLFALSGVLVWRQIA